MTIVSVAAVAAIVLSIAALMKPVPYMAGATTPGPRPTYGTPAPERPSVVFIGDSYSAGAGASTESKRWTTDASRDLGWSETNAALGGTGYVSTAGPSGCGLDYCGTYSEAIAGVKRNAPAFVVISGGRNDGTKLAQDPGAVEDTIRAAKDRWPSAHIIVTSPIWDDDAAPSWLARSIDIVRQACASTGATYIDLGEPLAGPPDYVASDGIHPNDAGHAAIAAVFVAAVKTAYPS